jgi:hypothetical protein
MLVFMLFEACEPANLDLEAAHLEFGLRARHKVLAGNELPIAGIVLVNLMLDAFPLVAIPLLDHSNITIAFNISPRFIA